jgi:hypothetical protein
MSETVTDFAPARRAAITVRQPIVPAPGDEHRLADEIGAALHRVQRDGERLRESELAQRDVARHGIALPLAHDEELAEHALHVRIEAGAAQEAHLPAQLLAALAAVVALAAGMRRAHRDLVSHFHACHTRAHRSDRGRRLVSRDQGLAHDEAPLRPSK